MAGGIGTSERVAQTTIEEWAKMVDEETVKRLIVFSMLNSKGRIRTGRSGHQTRWVVRKADHQLQPLADMQPVSFARKNTKTAATLTRKGYYVSDFISEKEKLEQGGDEAMIRVFANREQVMREGALRGLADKVFSDSLADSDDFDGLETLFSGIGAQTATDKLATSVTGTYAGLSKVENAVGTSAQPKLWTPVIVNTNRTVSAATQAWSAYGDSYLRTARLEADYGNMGGQVDLFLLNQDSFKELLDLLDDKERIPVSRGSATKLVQLGFENNVMLDGVPVTWDASVPTTDSNSDTVRGYGLTTDRMFFDVLGPANSKNLFRSKVTFNSSYQGDEIILKLYGNFCFMSPRHFVKLADIS